MKSFVNEYEERDGYEKVVFELVSNGPDVDLLRLAKLSVKIRLLAELDELEYRMKLIS